MMIFSRMRKSKRAGKEGQRIGTVGTDNSTNFSEDFPYSMRSIGGEGIRIFLLQKKSHTGSETDILSKNMEAMMNRKYIDRFELTSLEFKALYLILSETKNDNCYTKLGHLHKCDMHLLCDIVGIDQNSDNQYERVKNIFDSLDRLFHFWEKYSDNDSVAFVTLFDLIRIIEDEYIEFSYTERMLKYLPKIHEILSEYNSIHSELPAKIHFTFENMGTGYGEIKLINTYSWKV